MHKCKSPSDSSLAARPSRRKAGFSLIEVSMSLAIVAIAFVALIGLLPAGMKIFESSMNATAQTRITSHLTSLLLASDYKNFKTASFGATIYYYDVDGSYLDPSMSQEADEIDRAKIYAAKILTGVQKVPATGGGSIGFDTTTTATKVMVVIARNDAGIMADFEKVNSIDQLATASKKLKLQPIVLARMDLEIQ
jgi:uncharacterized protein (TIGR02598 family)